MTRVCFLLGGFQGNGGIGRVTSILVNEFCQENSLEIHTISYFQDQRPMLYNINPEVYSHVLYHIPYSMTKAILVHHAVQKVRDILKANRIDLLIACGALYYPLGILACKGTKTKCVCWEHTNPATSSDYKFQSLCRRYAARQSDYIVVLTKAAEEYYKKELPKCKDKITQIYNPIDSNVSRSAQYNSSSKKIISVGRLTSAKNFERLIEIAARILPDYPEWTWDIYGDGELKDSLQRLIEKKQLNRQVVLMGQVSDLYNRYGDYAFMVMTSRYEGFPMSLIEGAANRLPLISFDIPTGPNEIIMNGLNGYLVDASSDNDMIEKIRQLIENQALRESMSKEICRLADTFAIERILKQWKMLYNELK